MHRRWAWLGALASLACQLYEGGAGSAGHMLGDDSAAVTTTSAGTMTSGATDGTGDGSGDAGPGSGADETSTPLDVGSVDSGGSTSDPTGGSGTSGTALLVVVGAPAAYDFGNVALGGLSAAVLEVANEGDGEATGLGAAPPGGAFAFTGGGFPGAAGSCGTSLAAGASCSVELSFSPGGLGLHEGALAVAYDGGPDAIRPLVGGGMGQSANLLNNPGAEMQGNPPPSWTDAGPGSWIAGSLPMETAPVDGSAIFYADTGPNDQTYLLVQDVDVSSWATTIDLGLMRFSADGWGRALSNDDDDYRIRVSYRSAGGAELDAYSTGWLTSNGWQHHQDLRAAPANTREIRVELACRKNFGTYCHAYYDELDLHAVYP